MKDLFTPEFLAALCHDLRGPVGAFGTWVHVLGSGKASAETQARAIAAMSGDVRVLGGFIEQLALLGAVGAKSAPALSPLDVVPLLASTRSTAAADSDLVLTAEAHESELRVMADLDSMQQIFLLLGSRALTASGGERTVSLRQTGRFAELSLESAAKVRSLGSALLGALTQTQHGEWERAVIESRDVVRMRFPLAA